MGFFLSLLSKLNHSLPNIQTSLHSIRRLVEVFNGNKSQVNSPLLKQSSEDVMTNYNRAKDSLEDLEERMEKFLRLSSVTHDGPEIYLHELMMTV